MEIKKIRKNWEYFFEQLKAAICLAGGIADDRWAERTFAEVTNDLNPNGIYLFLYLINDPETSEKNLNAEIIDRKENLKDLYFDLMKYDFTIGFKFASKPEKVYSGFIDLL